MCVCVCVCVCVYADMCVCVCVCIYMYVCVCIYIYVYIIKRFTHIRTVSVIKLLTSAVCDDVMIPNSNPILSGLLLYDRNRKFTQILTF